MNKRTSWILLILLILSLAHTANAQTYVQSKEGSLGTAGNVPATFSAQPTAGDTVVAGVVCYGATSGCQITSVADGFGNSYSQVGPTIQYANTKANVALYCASGISSGSNFTVTATLSNAGTGSDSDIYIAEYSGLTCTVDQSASGANTPNTTTMQTSSVTTTNAADLLAAVAGASQGGAVTAGSGYLLRQNGSTGHGDWGGFEDQKVTATGSKSATMTLTTSTSSWALLMVALKASAGAAPTVTSFTPTSGPVGTSATITGTNFAGATAVKFHGTAATSFTVNSATQITATVPSGATTGTISITTPSGTGTSSTNFTVTTSGGAITYIQSAEKLQGAGTSTATFSTQPTVGNTVVAGLVCWASSGCQITSVTDNFSNSYAQIGTTAHYVGTQADVALYCASVVSTGSNFGVKAALSNSGGDSDLYIAEYSGLTCNVDQTASGSGSTSTTSLQTSSVTTTNPTDLLVAVAGSTTGNAATAGSGYALRQNDNGGTAEFGGLEDRTVTSTGSYSGSMTLAVSTSNWAMAMAALKGSSSGGATPTITSFTPTSGPVGTSMTITGTNFTGATAVKFKGTAATFTVNSSTQISTTVPSGATTGTISVTTPSGTGTSTGSFTVTGPAPTVTSFTPTSGPSGTSVTITGTNFTGATAVKFNAIAAQSFSVTNSTQIAATVSATDTTGPISVTTPSGTGTSTGSFTVTAPAPTITSFTPTSGPVGTSVTITGTNFTDVTAVKFSGIVVPFTVNSSTQITAMVPTGTTTGPISVTSPSGTGTSTGNFTVTVPITTYCPNIGIGNDDAACFNTALADVKTGGGHAGQVLEIPATNPMNGAPLTYKIMSTINLPTGVTVVQDAGAVINMGASTGVMFEITGVNNVNWSGPGGCINTSSSPFTYTQTLALAGNCAVVQAPIEINTGIYNCFDIRGGSNLISITGMTIGQCGEDGLYVTGSTFITWSNNSSMWNNRNGASVVSDATNGGVNHMTITGNYFSHQKLCPGICDGIDFEPNFANGSLQNIVYSNNTTNDNGNTPNDDAAGVKFSLDKLTNVAAVSITGSGNVSNNNSRYGYEATGLCNASNAGGSISLNNSSTDSSGNEGASARVWCTGGATFSMDHLTVTNPMQAASQCGPNAAVSICGNGGAGTTGNVSFTNVTVRSTDGKMADYFTFAGAAVSTTFTGLSLNGACNGVTPCGAPTHFP